MSTNFSSNLSPLSMQAPPQTITVQAPQRLHSARRTREGSAQAPPCPSRSASSGDGTCQCSREADLASHRAHRCRSKGPDHLWGVSPIVGLERRRGGPHRPRKWALLRSEGQHGVATVEASVKTRSKSGVGGAGAGPTPASDGSCRRRVVFWDP